MATNGATQSKASVATYQLAEETAGLVADAIEKRYDRSASGYGVALKGLCALYQLQVAQECINCHGSGVVDGYSCPNVVAHPGV